MDNLYLLRQAGFSGSPNHRGELPNQFCPYHEHRHRSPSLSVNIYNGFYCYSCGARGSIRKLLKDSGVSFYQTQVSYDEISFDSIDVHEEKLAPSWKSNDSEVQVWSKLYHPYMAKRGFDKPICILNKIGYDRSEARITIPVYFNGAYYGCVKRTVLDEEPKYTQPINFPRRSILYSPLSQPERSDVVIVVEGPLNAIRATQFGFRSVATFGCMPSQDQIDLVLNLKERRVVICPDNDQAGRDSLLCWADYDVDVMQLQSSDVCESSQEEFEQCLLNSEPIIGALI